MSRQKGGRSRGSRGTKVDTATRLKGEETDATTGAFTTSSTTTTGGSSSDDTIPPATPSREPRVTLSQIVSAVQGVVYAGAAVALVVTVVWYGYSISQNVSDARTDIKQLSEKQDAAKDAANKSASTLENIDQNVKDVQKEVQRTNENLAGMNAANGVKPARSAQR